MITIAQKNYVKNSIERLYGIIEGVAIDTQINDKEIIALKNWTDTHESLHSVEPFRELDRLLSDILEDGVIDFQEREDLLDWCAESINERGFLKDFTEIVRRLHGVLSGVICDRLITTEELRGLGDWLIDYENLHGWWPFNELSIHIKNILKDGKIDSAEQQTLQSFFNDFNEQIIHHPVIHDDDYWMNQDLFSLKPIFKPIASICESDPKIEFENKSFCFTGPAATARRKDLLDVIKRLGGIPKNTIITTLDYLVIGAQASPAWIYSTYGRKIETVMQRKQTDRNSRTQIISEYDFISTIKTIGGASFIPDPNRPLF